MPSQERVISSLSHACSSARSYKQEGVPSWEDCISAKSKSSVATSYFIDYKYMSDLSSGEKKKCNCCDENGETVYKVVDSKNIMMTCQLCSGRKWYYRDSVKAATVNAKRLLVLSSAMSDFKLIASKKNKTGKYWSSYFISRCLRTALNEVVEANVCKHCEGTGKAIVEGKFGDCGKCGGTGKASMTNKARCESMNVDASHWKRDFEEQYLICVGIFDNYEREFKQSCYED